MLKWMGKLHGEKVQTVADDLGSNRGSHGGATGGAALTFPPGWGAGRVFFQRASLRDKRLDRAGVACRSWARRNWRGKPSAY